MHGEEAADGAGRRKEGVGGGRDGGEIKRDELGWEMKGVVVEERRDGKGAEEQWRERERESA